MPKKLVTVQDLARIKIVGDPQISPDGKQVIFTVQESDPEKNKYWTHLWLGRPSTKATRQFTFGPVVDTSPRWSHDGQTLAFVRVKEQRSQIWLVPADGGEARALTDLPEGRMTDLTWSPDGHTLAFCYRPTHPDWTQEAAKQRAGNGKSNPARVTTRVIYRLDGFGFQDERQHVWTAEVATGKTTQLTRGDYDDVQPDWSPDGRTIAFVSNRSSDPERHSYHQDIWLVPARGGKLVKVATPVGEKSALAWSPDGRQIAYIGYEVGDDPWRTRNDRLWVVSKQGGNARCLTLKLDRAVGDATLGDAREAAHPVPIWSPDGKRVLFSVSDSGNCHLYAVVVATGQLAPLTRGTQDVSGVSLDAAGRNLALLIGEPTHPAEVSTGKWAGSHLTVSPLSHANDEWLREVQVSKPEEFWVAQEDGTRVQGWILRPPNMVRTRKYPLLVYVHGGPHAQYGNVFFHELQWHAARGYVVVYSNPRGSLGREEEYAAAIHRDWGHVDYEDVMAVTDYAVKLPYVDTKRTAIAGGSYGGYMTNWAVGHSDRFQCAVTDRCLSNFISMVGTSDMPPPPNSYWPGNPWGDDMTRGWDMSPIKFVDKVHTPMLIIHSEGDLRCPIEQSEQWFTALKWLKQQVVFVRYPRETSHGLSRNGPLDLRLDRLGRIGDWLDSHLLKRPA